MKKRSGSVVAAMMMLAAYTPLTNLAAQQMNRKTNQSVAMAGTWLLRP
jgi:hypothetical protein